jgi:hypothetical protein
VTQCEGNNNSILRVTVFVENWNSGGGGGGDALFVTEEISD